MNPEFQNSDRRFLELIGENRPKILKICRVYAWNHADQDDLYQEILFQIWRGLPTLKENTYASTWIYRIALNASISFVRKRTSRGAAQTTTYNHVQLEEILETQPITASESDQLTHLYEAMALLNDLEKALITLFLEDLSYEQIATVMGISESNVGVMLHRVKKKLFTLMKESAHE
ncbi:MAG: RNA polymerase sigma factor [Verrucomicrobiota bacterium]